MEGRPVSRLLKALTAFGFPLAGLTPEAVASGTETMHHDLVTQPLRDHRRHEHGRVEDDNHETIAKTSSSV